MRLQLSDRVAQCMLHLFKRAIDREIKRFRLMSDGNGFQTAKARFQHATFVRLTTLTCIRITEMHFDSSDAVRELR